MQITEDMREEIKVILDEAYCMLMEVLELDSVVDSIGLDMSGDGAASLSIYGREILLEEIDILPHDMEESLEVDAEEECPHCVCTGGDTDEDSCEGCESEEGSLEDLLRFFLMSLPHPCGHIFTVIKPA